MSWFLVPRGTVPPEGQEYLLSSENELNADKEQQQAFTDKWLAQHPFPGRDASSAAKIAWLAALHKLYKQELEDSFYRTSAPETYEIATKILMQQAPDCIIIEMVVKCKDLEKIQLDESQESLFVAALKEYGRKDYEGEATWEAYKAWLLEQEKGGTVVIGSIERTKDDEIVDACQKFCRNFGIGDFLLLMQQANSDETREACHVWGLMDVVGENLYFPREEDDTKYYYQVLLTLEARSESQKVFVAFHKSLEKIKQEYKEANDAKFYVLVYKADSSTDDDEPVPLTAEHCHVLWLPEEYIREHDRIRPHFMWGKGESCDLKQRLFKGNTDTGNIKADIFVSELAFLKQYTSWQSKFCAALALTRAAAYDTYWMYDNECPEEVAKMVKELATYWRTTLLKKDDETLGLGLSANETSMSESRVALYRLLETLAKQLEDGNDDFEIKFSWKPRPRKTKVLKNQSNKKMEDDTMPTK